METASESMENPSAREKRKTPLRSAPEEARAGAEGGRYAAMKGNGEGSARAGMVKDDVSSNTAFLSNGRTAVDKSCRER